MIVVTPDITPLFFFVCAWCAFAGLVLERFMHAFVYFLTSSFLAMGGGESVKRLASMEVLKESVTGVMESAYGVVQAGSTFLAGLLSSWVFILSVTVLVFVMATMQHESAELITTYVRTYNSDVSFSIRSQFLLAMQYGQRFLHPVLVLWNALFYTVKLFSTEVLLPILTESPEMVQKVIGSIAMFARSVSYSVVTFVGRLASTDCSIERLMNVQQVADKTLPCFVPGRRSLDLITPLGDFRLVAMYVLLVIKNACTALGPVVDVVIYPLLDLNFAKAVHSFVNALIYWFLNMPIMTVKRCSAAVDAQTNFEGRRYVGFLMCTPDMTPGFNYMIAGSRRLGQLVDNWVNVVWLVLLAALNLPAPQCAQTPLVFKAEMDSTLFGGNETRVVGLTSGCYALTDGNSVQYTFFLGQINHVFAGFAWRGQIAPRYGIAAVTYDAGDDSIEPNSGQQTMSMMGCQCLDVEDPLGYDFRDGRPGSRMVLECTVLRYDPSGVGLDGEIQDIASPHFVPVAFSVPQSAYYMRCDTTKIVVDSARFPLSRHGLYEEGGKSNMDDDADGEYTRADGVDGPDEVDAVIWVIPACEVESVSPSCVSALSASGCYPYCLAARKRAGRNNGLTLYSARDWANNIQLLDYDCAGRVEADTPNSVVEFSTDSSAPTKYGYTGTVYNNLDFMGGKFVFTQSWDPGSQACTFNPAASSRIRRGSVVTNATDIEKMNKMTGVTQPFAVAGETALTMFRVVNEDEDSLEPDKWFIRVQRLYGQQGTGMFGLVDVNSQLPARKPCLTQATCGTDGDTITSTAMTQAVVPYYVYADPATHNPAVMTKWGVIYAANPSYMMYSEFFQWCELGYSERIQVQLDSSHGPTRLWRVNAFQYDDPAGPRATSTGGVVEVPDGFQREPDASQCGKMFNVRVTSMEYLNDMNIAVTVLRSTPRNFNPTINNFETGVMQGADGQATLVYQIYFLNPETMRLRLEDMWEEEVAAAAQGILCPSQRRMPDFGSMTAEVLAAGLHAVRMFMELILTGPAVFSPGAYADIQTSNMDFNWGHSFLLNKGMGWLNFDQVFESLRRSHQHFWNSFTKIGALFDNAPYVSQFMNGLAMYNQDYTPLVQGNMRKFLGVGDRMAGMVDSKVNSMVETVAGKNPIVFTGLAASSGMLNMAQYALGMVRILIVQVLLPAIAMLGGGSVDEVVHGLWLVVYESSENYKTLILASELRSCVGLQLMMGYTNPFARLAGDVCRSGVMFKLGGLNTAMAFFVDLPVLGCLCKDSEGLDYQKHAMDTCYEAAPRHFKGVVRGIIDGSESIDDMCTKGGARVQTMVRNSMDPFLAASHKASAVLADVVDYTRYMWDPTAGSCRDYAGDASVTAIIPDPVEFWRICGLTKTCRNKCLGSFQAFELAQQQYGVTIRDVRRVTGQRTVKSAFFSDRDIISARSQAPFDIIEMSEMSTCMYTCGYEGMMAGDRCVAVLGLQYGVLGTDAMQATVVVAEYCVPQRLDSFVWLKRQWSVANSHDWAPGILQIKLMHQGRAHCMGYSGAFCSVAVLSGTAVTLYREDGNPYDVVEYSSDSERNTRLTGVHRIAALGNEVLIVSGSGSRDGPRTRSVTRSLCVDIRSTTWEGLDVSQCNQNVLDQVEMDLPVCLYDMFGACEKVMMVPTRDERPVVLCEWIQDSGGAIMTGRLQPRRTCEQFPLSKNAIKAAGLYNMIKVPLMGVFTTEVQQQRSSIVVSTAISLRSRQTHIDRNEYSVFVANHPKRHVNWLASMRIDSRERGLGFQNGIPVSINLTVVKGCRPNDCSGCTARPIQTLCYAAQQCTIANCIGTTVNLNKPLCAVGELLSDSMEFFLLQWRGSWNLMSIMIVQSIALATSGKQSTDSTMSGIDELFTAQICLQKDTIYDIAGTITSFVNANVGMVDKLLTNDGNVGALFQEPKTTDLSSEYREAHRTMTLAAVTRFLGNAGLAVVYPVLVARKMMMCQANDIIKTFDVTGMKFTITSPEYGDAYTSMAGTCLTDFESDNVETPESKGVDSALDSLVAWLGSVPFGNYKHVIDGGLSYVQGLIRGVQDLVQVADVQNCKLTDASMYRQGQCACADDPAQIPDARAEGGIADHAFWCTGFLQMETPFGQPYVLFNPYTYSELRGSAESTSDYLVCLSGGDDADACRLKKPVAPPLLEQQGAQLLPVLARCNANYNAMLWDPGTRTLFDTEKPLPSYLIEFREEIGAARALAAANVATARCMARVKDEASSDACLALHLASESIGLRREDYFVYAMIEPDPLRPGPSGSSFEYGEDFAVPTHMIAACVVFSGPTKNNKVGVEASKQFAACTTPSSGVSSDGSACELQAYVWSSKSRNAVPVASLHAATSTDLDQLAKDSKVVYKEISDEVRAAVKKAKDEWTGEAMEVSLFTSEGDILHQAFDCMFLGPYGRADLSPRDLANTLPGLEYFRDFDGGDTREFSLPCTGDEMHGDTKSPFTCGSDVRRSIIKNFVRHHMRDDTSLEELVKEQVELLFDTALTTFSDWNKFGCTCTTPPFAVSATCCAEVVQETRLDGKSLTMYLRSVSGVEKRELLEQFVPDAIQNFKFSTIENSGIVDDILADAFDYMETTVLRNVSTLVSYDVDHSKFALSDEQRELAQSEGLFTTSEPLVSYGRDEAFTGATTASAFEVCVGAVSQVMFTLPVGDMVTGAPTTAASMPAWDPVQTEPEGHLTALEAWVRRLVADAREYSPLFWSHRLKHVASDSRVCIERLAVGMPSTAKVWSSAQDKVQGHADLATQLHPGITSGIYTSILESLDGAAESEQLTFAPPVPLKGDTSLFRETTSGEWALGKIAEACFCGWASVRDEDERVWCQIPESVCVPFRGKLSARLQNICSSLSGMYWNHWEQSEDSVAVGLEMQQHLKLLDYLQCPWNTVDTAAWGLLDNATFVEQWLLEGSEGSEAGLHFTVKHLLHEGRGGMRFMNAESVIKRGRDNAYLFMNPRDVFSTIAQQHCERQVEAAAAADTSYSAHFRDVLFPVTQGIPENRGLSFCLRYVVELATATAMQHVVAETDIERVRQDEVVATWRRKCHTQTKLLGFCALRGVFSAHKVQTRDAPDPVVANTPSNHAACVGVDFWGDLASTDSFVVVGPTCLVVYHSAREGLEAPEVLIFDPCRVVNTCRFANISDLPEGFEPTRLNATKFVEQHRNDPVVKLDAMSFVSAGSRTLSLKWSKPSDAHWSTVSSDRERYNLQYEKREITSSSVGLDIEKLWQQYVRPAAPLSSPAGGGAAQEPRSAQWRTASGARAEDAAASCGGVSDWWPEEWEHPVGFHVTTPCKQERVAYRTFNNQFEYDAAAHAMRYRHSALRDERLLMNNAGASGMCRLNTLGQTLREQNNVRVCTRMRRGVLVDYAVPVLKDSGTEEWTDAQCSTSPHQVPWDPDRTAHARLRSVGLLASWPEHGAMTWPSPTSPMMHLGLDADDHADSWTEGGGDCGMPGHFSCYSDEDCQVHVLGVSSHVVLKCLSSVCVVSKVSDSVDAPWATEDNYMQCSSHHDCANPAGFDRSDLLCSGEGRCVHPVLEVHNAFGADIDLAWHAKTCDESSMESVDMYGKSPWGRISGLFEAHGLCSYRNWYEYRHVFEENCGTQQTESDLQNNLCTLGEHVHWVDTAREETEADIFASQKILHQQAHRCDRDVQHMEQHVMCRPRVSSAVAGSLPALHSSRGRLSAAPRYSPLYQTYYREKLEGGAYGPHAVKLAFMEYMSNLPLGFLGVEEENHHTLDLVPCADIPQCSTPSYYIQNNPIPARHVLRRDATTSTEFSVTDAVQCGSFGAAVVSTDDVPITTCHIDFAVAPLALMIILDENMKGTASGALPSAATRVNEHCEMSLSYADLQENLREVKRIGYEPTSLDRERVRGYLTETLTTAFATDFSSLEAYSKRVKCGEWIQRLLQDPDTRLQQHYRPSFYRQEYQVTVSTPIAADGASNSTAPDPMERTLTLHSTSVLNHFTMFAMVELPPMWWVKCHLLSGLAVSDKEAVDCPAWNLWMASRNPAPGSTVPTVTFKKYLQQTAVALVNTVTMRARAQQRVRSAIKQSLSFVHDRLRRDGGPPLRPMCNTQKLFVDTCDGGDDGEAFELMVFTSYELKQRDAINAFDKACCKGEAGCTVSAGLLEANQEPPQPNAALQGKRTIEGIVEKWLTTGYYGELVDVVSDEEMLSSEVRAWGDPEVSLFTQPWLHMGGSIPPSLAAHVSRVFKDITASSCEMLWFQQGGDPFPTEDGNGTRTPCIFKNNPSNDPYSTWVPGDASVGKARPFVKLIDSDDTGVDKYVCREEDDTTAINNFRGLGQRCNVGFSSPQDANRDSSTEWDCNGLHDPVTGCHRKAENGEYMQPVNPHPERVCYEVGNSCFTSKQDKFSSGTRHTWTHAELPAGVSVRTYGYEPNDYTVIGRNPRYVQKHERIVWSNTHFDPTDVKNRVDFLAENEGPRPKVYAVANVINRITRPARRLLGWDMGTGVGGLVVEGATTVAKGVGCAWNLGGCDEKDSSFAANIGTDTPIPTVEYKPGPVPPVETCMIEYEQWPPLVQWSKEAQGDGAACEECKENSCLYQTTLTEYQGAGKYPPWFNCAQGGFDEFRPPRDKTSQQTFAGPKTMLEVWSTITGNGVPDDEARSYMMENFDLYDTDWLDYDRSPTFAGVQVQGGSPHFAQTVVLPAEYNALSLELLPGFSCTQDECDGMSVTVGESFYYCSECSRYARDRVFCEGQHDCHVGDFDTWYVNNRAFDATVGELQGTEIARLRDKLTANSKLSVFETSQLLVHLAQSEYRERFLYNASATRTKETPGAFNVRTRVSQLRAPLPAIVHGHPAAWTYEEFDPKRRALPWERSTGKKTPVPGNPGEFFLDKQACVEEVAETNQVNYRQCSHNEQLIAMRGRVNTAYNSSGPPIIPDGYFLQLPVEASKLVADDASEDSGVLLMWAKHARDPREKHFEYLMDFATQCRSTTINDAVCRISPVDGATIELLNPWTGGGFNVRAGCDIGMSRSEFTVSEVYTTSCVNGLECPTQDNDSPFYRDQSPGCRELNGDPPMGERIVGPWMQSNVCLLKPTAAGGPSGVSCKHRQGLLGGGSGTASPGAEHANLYEYANASKIDDREPGGLFVLPQRAVFRTPVFAASNVRVEKNFLNLNTLDIGGHQMHFVVSSSGVLHLYDLVLAGAAAGGAVARKQEVNALMAGAVFGAKKSADAAESTATLHRWLAWDIQAEHLNETAHEPDMPSAEAAAQVPLHWACPLKQRLYLSGQAGAHFRPSLPNSRRAATMFQHHSVDKRRSNSVQAAGMAKDYVNAAAIKTSNGFCFCDSPASCQHKIGGNELCSLSQTVEALSLNQGRWHKSKVDKGSLAGTCVEQVDWPYTGGQLRDGSFIGQGKWAYDKAGPDGARVSQCNLLDRMHDFEYRYVAGAAASDDGAPRNTEAPGGDCYTGKARRAGGQEEETVEGGGGGAAAAAAGYVWNPSERRSCATQCPRPPVFTAGGAHTEIPAETSFGVLYRERSERAIAGNLRERLRASLCAGAAAAGSSSSSSSSSSTCETLDHMLNVSSWVPGAFWDAFVQDVTTLFTETTFTTRSVTPLTQKQEREREILNAQENATTVVDTPPPQVPLMSARQLLDEASADLDVSLEELNMWDVKWVYCDRVQPECVETCNEETSFCTRECSWEGSSVGRCHGTIDRSTWLDPAQRKGACAAVMSDVQHSDKISAVAPINICDMDPVTNQLCGAIQAAKNKLFEQNCIASGVCKDEKFFYVPGIYSAANQEFVRATVENFYLQAHSDSCPLKDKRDDEIDEANGGEDGVSQCASTQLQIAHNIIRDLRGVVDRIMRIGYFFTMIVLNLGRYLILGVGAGNQHAWHQVQLYSELMLEEMQALWEVLGDLVYNFMMDSGFGKALQAIIKFMCAMIQVLYDIIFIGFTCPLMRPIGEAMVDLVIGPYEPFKAAGNTILDFYYEECIPNRKICNDTLRPDEDPDPTSLPVPTRCWSTYSTFLGDAKSLSCSAADTCMAGDLSTLSGPVVEKSQVAGSIICDSCPQAPSASFSRYGCDIVTKTCKCGVQTLLRTTCITNDECSFAGSSCDIVDNLFERDAFGSITCAECATDRICLVSPGDSIGHCSCATRPMMYTSCEANRVGLSVRTGPFAVCMVALGSNVQAEVQGSAEYRVESSKLATARCDMLDGASRFCVNVEMGPGFSKHLVVGMQNLFSRRLLSIGDSNSPTSSFFRFVIPPEAYEHALHADWSAVHTHACRHVPRLVAAEQPNATEMALADTELLRACVRWRAIGLEIVHLTNISDFIPDTFLVGPEDFAYDVVAHPNRLFAVLQRPWVVVRALMHTQAMAPLRVVVRDLHRWWVHSQIAAVASANELAADKLANDGGPATNGTDGNHTTRTNGSDDHTAPETLLGRSQDISRHMTGQLWAYLYPGASRGDATGHAYQDAPVGVNETLQREARRRRMRAHTTALGHSLLHTRAMRAHWVPEEQLPHSERADSATTAAPKKKKSPPPAGTAGTAPRGAPTHSRTLKEAVDYSFINRMNAVQQYSSDVALGEGVIQILPQVSAEEYVRGPFLFPPTFVYWGGGSGEVCSIATNAVRAVQKAATMLRRSYDANDILALRPPVSYNPLKLFTEAWTRGNSTARQVQADRAAARSPDGGERTAAPRQTFEQYMATGAPWYIRQPVQWLTDTTGVTEMPLLGLLYEAPAVLSRMLRCNIEAQMFCSSHHYSIFTSAFIALGMLTLINAVVSYTGMPLVSTLLSVIGFGSLVLFIAFDYSPGCAPLVPVCFFESIVADITYWLPTRITVPQSLLLCQVDQTTDNVGPECVVDCHAQPFYFNDYNANIAWLLCQASAGTCHSLELYLERVDNPVSLTLGKESTSLLQAALYRSRTVMASGDQNIVEGFQWCNLLSIYQLVPIVALLFFMLAAVPLALAAVIKAIVGLVRAAFSAYAMTHL